MHASAFPQGSSMSSSDNGNLELQLPRDHLIAHDSRESFARRARARLERHNLATAAFESLTLDKREDLTAKVRSLSQFDLH